MRRKGFAAWKASHEMVRVGVAVAVVVAVVVVGVVVVVGPSTNPLLSSRSMLAHCH